MRAHGGAVPALAQPVIVCAASQENPAPAHGCEKRHGRKEQKVVRFAGDHPQAKLLEGYVQQVLPGDASNREGHAAKVYFNALFGMSFKRGDENFLNGALNYGYAVLLSAFNREVVANGYNMQLGLAHKNEFNPFNLSCDLMEPFRVLVDRFVFASGRELTPDYKHALCDILNQKVRVGQETCTVSAAIGAYCRSVFDVLEGGTQAIKCYEL